MYFFEGRQHQMAEYIIWKDEYSASEMTIDFQHRQIIGIINAMFALVKNKISGDEITKLLANLKNYTETHFDYEEKIIKMINYPDIKKHKTLHKIMAEKTAALCKVQKSSVNGIMPDEVLGFLKDWWVNHIRNLDVQYVPFLPKQN
jgi:methyl-accepting chemotaxis protein/hemerythrin